MNFVCYAVVKTSLEKKGGGGALGTTRMSSALDNLYEE